MIRLLFAVFLNFVAPQKRVCYNEKNQEKKKVISWILQEKRKRLSGQGRRKPALTIK